jgi:parallel beta-helix repeat protein
MRVSLFGGFIVLTAAAVPALAETPITSCPFTINTPGNYVLAADLTCSTPLGISITASNVSLNLNGHKITLVAANPPSNNAIVVGGDSVGRVHHVGIQGPGLITSFSSVGLFTGIALVSADYSQVSQVTIMGAVFEGGISTQGCNFLTLTSNVIGRTFVGVTMFNTNSSSVTRNDVSGDSTGIELVTGSGNTISNNVANGNSGRGVDIGGDARVYGNVTNGNGSYGISNFSTLSQVFSNTSKANGQFDLFDQNACSGSWGDNVFFTANSPCIH